MNQDFSKLYSWAQLKKDSDHAIKQYHESWWKKFEQKTKEMRQQNDKYFGKVVSCLLASSILFIQIKSYI
jgi:hypothetical protein